MTRPQNVDVVVLAGGLGTRLRSAVPDKPKALARINGVPFLQYVFNQLSVAGFRRVILCTGHMGEQIQVELSSIAGDLAVICSKEETPLGTAGALKLAAGRVQSDIVLALNGDSLVNTNLGGFLRWYEDNPQFEVALMAVNVVNAARFGTLEISEGGRLASMQEKRGLERSGWINAGVYLITRRQLDLLPGGHPLSLEIDVFPDWIARRLIGVYPTGGDFIDIGTPESFAAAAQFFR